MMVKGASNDQIDLFSNNNILHRNVSWTFYNETLAEKGERTMVWIPKEPKYKPKPPKPNNTPTNTPTNTPMNRGEAIKVLRLMEYKYLIRTGSIFDTALGMAIEALKGEQLDEWCTDCKEYDTEKKCCPRFNKVIREALNREPSEDGTLEVKVEDATKVGRVLISDDKHSGGLYYPDEDEPKGEPMKTTDYCDICKRDMCEFCVADNTNPYCVPSHYEIKQDEPQKGDLISRADAIETIELVDWYHQNRNKDMVHGANDDEHQAWYKAQDIYKALEAVPSADRPRGEWKQIEINGYPYAVCDQCHLLADIVEKDGELVMSMANADEKCANFCPNCGADMRGEGE